MKTRLLMIIGIVLASVVISSVYVISVQDRCETILGDSYYPRPLNLWNCLDYLNMVDNPPPKSSAVIPDHSPKLISKSLAIFYAAEQRDLTEEDLKKYDSRATLLKIRNNGFAFEIDPSTLEERELYMNRFSEYPDGQYIWLVFLVKNNEYQYHINATDGKILLSAQDGTVLTEPEPAPFPSKCKSGPAPSNEYYFDGDTCDWYLIQEPRAEVVFPYIWNTYLHKNSVDFSPQERSYVNTDEGYFPDKETRVCSPLVTSDGDELYISSTFTVEPFEIIDTVTSETQPDDCHKIWKTETLLVEPSPELDAWLKNYWEKENED